MSEIYAAGAVVGALTLIGLMGLSLSITKAGAKLADAQRRSTKRLLDAAEDENDAEHTVDEMWKEGDKDE